MKIRFSTPKITIGARPNNISINTGRVIIRDASAIPVYDGDYTVIPAEYEQVLETQGKRMTDNVTVAEVPFGLATIAQINRLFQN